MQNVDLIEARSESKRARLRAMQRLATSLLVAMLVLLALSVAFRDLHPGMHWLQAFAAAASVGAIADWFAVVALFHRPFGLPMPHTAIVGRNKDRIAASLGDFVEHNFLTAENVARKLEQRNLSRIAADWLVQPDNARHVATRVCGFLPEALDALADEDVRRLLDRTLAAQLGRVDAARGAGILLAMLTADGRHQTLLDRALRALESWLAANEADITAKFGESSRYTPRLFDAFVVKRFVSGIVELLHEVARDPEHELRRRFDRAIAIYVDKLCHTNEYQAQAERLKRELIAHFERENYYDAVWQDIKRRIRDDVAAPASVLRDQAAAVLVKFGAAVLDDAELQRRMNAWLVKSSERLVLRHRHHASSLITEVVKGWDARELSEKMELEMGRDLQYIRINGTLVGGLVGLVLHTLTGLA